MIVGSLFGWVTWVLATVYRHIIFRFVLSGKYLLYEYLSIRANIVDTFFRLTSALSFPTADIPLSCIVVNSVGRSVVRALSVSLEGTAAKEERGEAIKVTSRERLKSLLPKGDHEHTKILEI